jgi:hypothetical protein
MRQAWINNLRDAMASFISYKETPDTDPSKNREYWEKAAKIDLLMSPDDPDYDELQTCFVDSDLEKSTYMSVCQRILKREWEVLKREVARAAREEPDRNSK